MFYLFFLACFLLNNLTLIPNLEKTRDLQQRKTCNFTKLEQKRFVLPGSDFKNICNINSESTLDLRGRTLSIFSSDEFLFQSGFLNLKNGKINIYGSPKVVTNSAFQYLILENININLCCRQFNFNACRVIINENVNIFSYVIDPNNFPEVNLISPCEVFIENFGQLTLGPNLKITLDSGDVIDERMMHKKLISMPSTLASLVFDNVSLITKKFGFLLETGALQFCNQVFFKSMATKEELDQDDYSWELNSSPNKLNVFWKKGAHLVCEVPVKWKQMQLPFPYDFCESDGESLSSDDDSASE